MFRTMNPVARAAIMGILFAAICAAGMYFRAVVIEHHPYEPNWLILGAAALLWFAADMLRYYLNR